MDTPPQSNVPFPQLPGITTQVQTLIQHPDYEAVDNPRLGYWFVIAAASIVVFASLTNTSSINHSYYVYAIVLGALSFAFSFGVIIAHYWRPMTNFFLSGNGSTQTRRAPLFELVLLAFLSLWWIVGVALLTQARGIAYWSLNVYYASWLTLAVTLRSLNDWFVAKGRLSARDFLNQSPTLSAWYSLLLVSTIELGSSANVFDVNHALVKATNTDGDWIFAIVAGAISFALSALVILAHYQIKMLRWLAPGSLAELAVSFVCLCLWMVAVAILARDGGIAANFSSTLGINATANVYYSLWICFFNSVYILSKWRKSKDERAELQRQASTHNIDSDDVTDDL